MREADHKQREEKRPLAPARADEATASERHDPRLYAVADALEQLDRAASLAETIALASETLISNFKINGLALALRDGAGNGLQVTGLWGLPAEIGYLPEESIGVFLARNKAKRAVRFDARMQDLLPQLQATICTSFPLQLQEERLGFLAIVDTELSKGDSMLVSMVAHAAAARLARIVKDAEQARANEMSARLMSLTDTLLMIDDKDELYRAILGIASDLTDATQGSVMLIDKGGKNLQIVCSRGMAADLDQHRPLNPDRGIASTVASSGQPLLVHDLEKDPRQWPTSRASKASHSSACR